MSKDKMAITSHNGHLETKMSREAFILMAEMVMDSFRAMSKQGGVMTHNDFALYCDVFKTVKSGLEMQDFENDILKDFYSGQPFDLKKILVAGS